MPNKILIVEEELHILRLLQVHLLNAGYEVVAASTARQAVDIVQRKEPDIVIIDQTLPDKDGDELARTLRQLPVSKKLSLLLVFPKGIKETWVQGWIELSDCYITKPFNPEEVVKFVQRIMSVRSNE